MQRRFWTTVIASALGVGLLSTLLVATTQLSRAQEQPPQNTEQPQSPLGTTFTYQGQLKRNGAPVADNCSMAFRLYDQASNGNVIGNPIMTIVSIDNGLFTEQLDFGASAFAGEARWLGIQVKCPTDSTYVDLGRQALTAAPYSMYSTSTGALQGRAIASTAPGSGQVLKWNGSTWSPADDAIGIPGGDITAVYAGSGLSGGGTTGEVTLTVAFAGTGAANSVARSDHNHSGVYSLVGHTHSGSDVTSPVASATNADTVDGQHAGAFAVSDHHHWGARWSGIGQGLVLTGTTIGLTGATTETNTCNRAYGVKGSLGGGGSNPYCDSAAVMGEGGNEGVLGVGTSMGTIGVGRDYDGVGVYGLASSTLVTATNYGVKGIANGVYTMTAGVYGSSSSSVNLTVGVYGRSNSNGGAGVLAHNFYGGPGLRAHSYTGNLIEGWSGDPPGGTRRFWVDNTGNLFATGSKAGFVVDIARNADSVALQPGDLVAVVGVSDPIMGEIPVMEVRRATAAAPSAIVGVVDQLYVYNGNPQFTLAACAERAAAPPDPALPMQADQEAGSVLATPPMPTTPQDCRVSEGLVTASSIRPGEYLSVVTLGAYKAIKVDASFGAIRPGDLLIASPNPGYAMKAVDPKPGTIVGKALEMFNGKTGVIKILVTLQ